MITRWEFISGSLAAAAATAVPATTQETALDRYIAIPTPEYAYEVVRTIDNGGYRTHVISMTSQRWRSSREVDRPLWRHWITIIEPRRIKTRIGVLVISGGSNSDQPPEKVERAIGDIANRTGMLVAEVRMVPNQPLVFSDDGKARSEDDLIAYSWNKYLHTGDDTWPLRLPMTKAVVRAMDTVTAFSQKAGHKPVVDRFVVGGSSKRGWTAWLTPVVDERVVAIVPVVIDVLNVEPSALHAYRTYGTWPPTLRPYEKIGIMKWFGTPQFDALLQIEDPYSYRDRITIPKLIVNATGDQFFTPDSWRFYYNGLLGKKYLRYLPNTDHSLKGVGNDAARTAIAFLDDLVANAPLPAYSWHVESDGTLVVQCGSKPLAVRLWEATNPDARDFRLDTIGHAFTETDLHDSGGFTFLGKSKPPQRGYTAYFVEMTYPTLRNDVFTVTTGVQITPDVLPYPAPRV